MDLSIVIPVYNVEKYIEKCIHSLINQNNYSLKFEIILVDDGSKDNSINVAAGLLNGTNINYRILKQKNSGVSVARNNGLINAKGNYVYFLDSDDYVATNFLFILSEALDIQNDIVFWAYNIVDNEYKVKKSYLDVYSSRQDMFSSGLELFREIIIDKGHWIWTGSAIYSRRFLNENKLKFNERHTNGEDQEFIFSALLRAANVKFISRVLSFYLSRPNSVSSSFNLKNFDCVLALGNVRDKLLDVGDKELINCFNSHIVDNYLFVYKTGLKLYSANYMYKKIQILKSICPEYLSNIYEMMKGYRSRSFTKNLEVFFAKKSLLIYGHIFRLFSKLKR